jgi:hypothetical protein
MTAGITKFKEDRAAMEKERRILRFKVFMTPATPLTPYLVSDNVEGYFKAQERRAEEREKDYARLKMIERALEADLESLE